MPTRGDLPDALVRAGMALLEDKGLEGLTLRRVAARAGVSHAAPAHHFGGLRGLKVAIATHGFQTFRREMVAARDSLPADSDPFRALLTVNLAYIRFAESHMALFRLMFDQLPAQDPGLRDSALNSYLLLRDLCAPFVRERPAVPLETAVWGLTHGYAAMNMGNAQIPGSPIRLSPYEDALRVLVG